MFNFFSQLFDTISLIFSFALNFLQSFVSFFFTLFNGVAYLTAVVAYLPAELVAVALVIIGMSIIFLILGR